jgi:hypothetical protein
LHAAVWRGPHRPEPATSGFGRGGGSRAGEALDRVGGIGALPTKNYDRLREAARLEQILKDALPVGLRTASRVSLRLFAETNAKPRKGGFAYVTAAMAYSPVIGRSSRETTAA